MNFQPITKRFRVPGDTSNDPYSVIVITQDERGTLQIGFGDVQDGWLDIESDNDRPCIVALGFPVDPQEVPPDPPIDTLVEVPADE